MARFRRVGEYSREAKSVGVSGYRRRDGTLIKRHRRKPVRSVSVNAHLQHIAK